MISADRLPQTVPALARADRSGMRSVPTSDVELREVVRILQRRRLAILGALALGILIAGLSVLLSRNKYSATATIEVNRESGSSLGFADLSGIAGSLGDQEGMNMDLLTQQAVIMSDNTALRVIEDLKLDSSAPYAIPSSGPSASFNQERRLPLEQAPQRREQALRVFRSGLRVNPIKGTRLLTVTYTDTDANRAAAIANDLVDAYTSESTRARFQASSKTSMWLAGQLADLKRKVSDSQAKVDAFQRSSGLTAIPTLASRGAEGRGTQADDVSLARLVELNRDLTNAEATRIAREAIYRMTETRDPETVLSVGSSALAGGLGSDSPVAPASEDLVLLQRLQQQLAQVKIEEATAGTKYGAKNPAMLQLKTQEDSIRSQILAELGRMRVRAKNDLDLAILDEGGLRRQVAQQEQVVNAVAENADKLILLQEEAQSSRQIYQDLYTKLEEASVTAGIKASNIALVDPARAPAQPSYPKKRLTLALGLLAGLVFGLAAAFTWDYFDDSLAMPEEAERIAQVPVIGTIPDFHRRRNAAMQYGLARRRADSDAVQPHAWLLRAPRSSIAEAYRALRTALLLSRAEQAPRMILFMSGSAEEGKSTTCLNTAAAFALQGDRVLYLDADLRRAKGHVLFGCANEVGLSNCLTSGLAFPAALKPYPKIDSLFLLPAGPHPPNPSELLGSRRFSDLLNELRTHFDYIFIDSPPVLLVTDAQVIAPLVDGYVLVVRANRTLKRFLHRSLALMSTTHASLVGIVMNAFKAQAGTASAYGYYGNGGGYYADESE